MESVTSAARGQRYPRVAFTPQPSQWVQLRDQLPGYGYHQAVLLCETHPGEWRVWIPDHGEATLTREQFLSPED